MQEIFEGIGIPEPGPFRPDPFQLEALKRLKSADVLVSAPTGSGKTWIATEAIKDCLAQEKRAWYASPLKALSNSKFLEFTTEFGERGVGILTGDRKENADASVIVGTTEIIRNHLYDAMSEGTQVETDLIILDEAHYLGDQDRGVVWEEVLIYLPSRVNLLLLSATIQNSEEIARWLKEIRGKPCEVVTSRKGLFPSTRFLCFLMTRLSPCQDHRAFLIKSVLLLNALSQEIPENEGVGSVLARSSKY